MGQVISLSEQQKIEDEEFLKKSGIKQVFNQYQSIPVKLKHYLSEKYLFAVPFKNGFLMVVSNQSMKPMKKSYIKLNLVPIIKTSDDVLVDRKIYTLQSKNYFLKFDPKITLSRKFLNDKKSSYRDQVFMPLEDDELDEKNLICTMEHEDNNNEHGFKIMKLSPDERLDLAYAKSGLPFILYFISFFHASRIKLLKPSIYLKMEGLLKKICCFLHKLPYKKMMTEMEFDMDPVPYR